MRLRRRHGLGLRSLERRGLESVGTLVGLGLSLGLGCSTVDRGPIAECRTDADCGTGAVCSVAQGGICVPEELPPRSVLGFDIRAGEVRVELHGCDPEISTELGGSELRVARRDTIAADYQLRVDTLRAVSSCGLEECAGECDALALTCLEPMDATARLSADSRLNRTRVTGPAESYVTMPDPPLGEEELPTPLSFSWARYDSLTLEAHAAAVLDVSPPDEVTTRAHFMCVLAEDAIVAADGELSVLSRERCQRGIFGNEGAVRTAMGLPIAGASIDFSYAEALASPSTVLGGAGPACEGNEDCGAGWACDPDLGRCGLDLRGTAAGSAVTLDDVPGAFQAARVYTYCEDEDSGDDPLTREFSVRVTPSDESGLPVTTYRLTQTFSDPPTPTSDRRVPLDGSLCLPDWQPPVSLSFLPLGQPVQLLTNELGTYTCCSTECLPVGDPELVPPTPPPTVESCSDFERIRFETKWTLDDPETWADDFGCDIPTQQATDGSRGRFVRDVASCEEDLGCVVPLTTGAVEDLSREYVLTVVQPVGSVFRSYRDTIEIGPDVVQSGDLGEIELRPRVLLRGRITCAEGNLDCSSIDAVFAAERLITDSDEPASPGPFFFEARADINGSFVLPVDPGLYVVTAYPAVGEPGGPAPFTVLDLREDSPRVNMIDGVPNVTIAPAFELEDGLLVRALLREFDVSTVVTPIDTGSWNFQNDEFLYDLNDPGTCHGSSQRGCLIRRLRPTDASISLLITKRFQFTTRSVGPDSCPG